MQQYLIEDDAHYLHSRGVIQLSGIGVIEVLQPLVTSSLAELSKKSLLTYMLDEAGNVFADMFVVRVKNSHRDDSLAEQIQHAVTAADDTEKPEILLLDCASSQLAQIIDLLAPQCESGDVSAVDVSAGWRVFAELPDQSTFKVGEYIKYVDPRWHMGARLLRPASVAQSSQWQSELHWLAHVLRLGVLPSGDAIANFAIEPREANLQSIGVLDSNCVSEKLQAEMALPLASIRKRILPMRIEPSAFAFATMTGLPVLAGSTEIATVVAHQGIYALALVELEPWRNALQAGKLIQCAEQTVLITWPSWLAQESRGRMGPVALAAN
jgi:hypothetical protein